MWERLVNREGVCHESSTDSNGPNLHPTVGSVKVNIAKTLAGVKISVSRPKWTAKHPCVAAGVIGQRTSHLTYLVA